MTVAELFVNIGIKGEGSAKKALEGTKTGLGDVTSAGLAAKAAIVAAIYGLEQLMSHSAQAGTSLTNFSALTGISNQELQKWQWAGQQAGESFEEVASSIKNVQTQMQAIRNGGGPSGAFGTIAQYLPGGIDENKAFKDPLYMMKKLQEFSQLKTLPEAFKNQFLSSFVSEGTIAAMKRNAFSPTNLARAPTYSEAETKSLDKVNVSWKNLGTQIDMAMGHFNSKHGQQLVDGISRVTVQVFKLVEAFQKLAEKLNLFKQIGKIFEGWTMIFGGASKGVDAVTGAINNPKKRDQLEHDALDFIKEMPSVFSAMGEDIMSYISPTKPGVAGTTHVLSPQVQSISPNGGVSTINAPQTVTIIGQKSPDEIGQAIRKHHKTNMNRAASSQQKRTN